MSTPSGKAFDPFDLSPYAPKRARERYTLDRPPVENDSNDDNNSDDKRAKEAAVGAAVPLPSMPRAAVRREAAGEHPVDLDAGNQAQSRLRPDTSAGQVAETPTAGETGGDPDLSRLESSLQWLQREGAVGRLPRAVQLPPVSGLRPVSPEDPRPRGEQVINGVRVPPSLLPQRLPPPPLPHPRHNLPRPSPPPLATPL